MDKMRLLLIHNYYQRRGGEDVIFEQELELLRQRGHEVDTLIFNNAVIASPLQQVLTGFWTLYNPITARQLSQKIESYRPDLIHVYNFFPLASPAVFMVARQYGVPVVVNVQNYRLICPGATLFYRGELYERSIDKRFPLDAIRKGVYRNSPIQTAVVAAMTGLHKMMGTWRKDVSRFVVPTEFAKQKLLHSSLGATEEQFYVKPNFTFDLGQGEATRDGSFVFVGRLDREKGISVLLQAAQIGQFRLDIIGDGPLRAEVETACQHNPRIRFHGQQDQTFIRTRLKQAQALLFPSVWYEGLPMTILEALSTGTPVIASRLGGPAEVIQHQYNGLLFQPGSVDDLLLNIARLADVGLYEQLRQQARLSYETRYSPAVVYQSQMQLYDSLLK